MVINTILMADDYKIVAIISPTAHLLHSEALPFVHKTLNPYELIHRPWAEVELTRRHLVINRMMGKNIVLCYLLEDWDIESIRALQLYMVLGFVDMIIFREEQKDALLAYLGKLSGQEYVSRNTQPIEAVGVGWLVFENSF